MGSVVQDIKDVLSIGKGMWITLKHTRRKNICVEYPEKKRQPGRRDRWRHQLHRYENGLERCIGCSLCAAACPAGAIYVEAAENVEGERRSPGERYAKRYEINITRCIFCGYCEEACPTQAVVLGHDYELVDESRERFIYTKDRLLVPAAQGRGRPPEGARSLPLIQVIDK